MSLRATTDERPTIQGGVGRWRRHEPSDRLSGLTSLQQEASMAEPTRFDLSPDDIPTAWFNIMPDIVGAGIQPLPPLHPGTKEPITPDLLAPLFPEALILQEVSTEERIDVPGEVLDVYRLWRPTPL